MEVMEQGSVGQMSILIPSDIPLQGILFNLLILNPVVVPIPLMSWVVSEEFPVGLLEL